MIEFVVIVEGPTDVPTVTKLAERVLVEKIDWLEEEQLQYQFQWKGLKADTEYSYWRDIKQVIEDLQRAYGYRPPRYLGHGKYGPFKADGAAAMKVLSTVRFLQKAREIKAVLLIRDLDNQPERRDGLEQARLEHTDRQPQLGIVIGTADRVREAWVLNGFLPFNDDERGKLDEMRTELNFHPCEQANRLRSNVSSGSDRIRNPKVVLDLLTDGNRLRQQKCWEETDLELLRRRGMNTGLKDYMDEIEQYLIPIINL